MLKRSMIVLVGCAGLMLAGCGDDDDGGGGSSDDTDAAAQDGSGDTASDDTTAGSDASDETTSGTDDTGDDSGDSSGEFSDDDYVTAMIEAFNTEDPADIAISPDQAECVAPRWIEILDADRLAEAGITPEQIGAGNDMELTDLGLTEDEGNAMYDTFGECDVDFAEVFAESLQADEQLTPEQQECLIDAFDEDLLRQIMVTSIVEGDEALDANEDISGSVFGAFGDCDLLEELDD